MTTAPDKHCGICGEDCSNKPRTRDAKGRYFCRACYDKAAVAGVSATSKTAATPTARSPSPAARAAMDDDRGEYGLEATLSPAAAKVAASSEHARPPIHARPSVHAPTSANFPYIPISTIPIVSICPSCDQRLAEGSVVCIGCGINVVSGRSILTAEQGDTDKLYEHARGILWFASWLLLIGLLPISSEAHGSRKPWMLRTLALFTVLTTMGMWWFEWTDSPAMRSLKNQFLWSGSAEPEPEYIEMFFEYTSFGDRKAFERTKIELSATVPEYELAPIALAQLPESKQCFGEFRIWQLLTHAFLHADVLHLLSNLLFMLVFGLRINALIGNVGTLLVYPVLAVASALPQVAASAGEMPTYMLGASGAIMGLAGMYLVFFPVSPVHVAAFIRVPILLLGFFKCRGIWILLLYFTLDVVSTLLRAEDGVAHWAHMGGFLGGVVIGLILLVTRGVNARGNDLVSVLLGRHAWALLGRPAQWRYAPDGEGWLTRLTFMPRSLREEFAAAFSRDGATPSAK